MKKSLIIAGGIVILVVATIVVKSGLFKVVEEGQAIKTQSTTTLPRLKNVSGKIVFASRTDGVTHISIMNADGTNVKQLTSGTGKDVTPEISRDGKKILFQREENGFAVYSMNIDGSNLKRLSPTPGRDLLPDWSPDGTKIIFTRVITPPSGSNTLPQTSIMVMNADGSNTQMVYYDKRFNMEPRWSLDGSKVAFMCGPLQPGTEGVEICLMNADGTNVIKLTNEKAVFGDPHWSPDGKKIAFGSNKEGGGKVNIFVMNADGTNVKQLTHFSPPYEAGDVGWSSDGTKMAFEWDVNGQSQSDPNAHAEVWIMNADGTNQVSTGQTCSNVGCAPRWLNVK